MDKYKYTDVKTIIAKIPIEMVGEISWNGERYEYFNKDEVDVWKQKYADMYDAESNTIVIVVDTETSYINNFPQNEDGDFTAVKVVDSGEYTLISKDGKVIFEYEGYVPDCFEINENGYGDYMEFFVVKGVIAKWKWNDKLFQDILKESY